MDFREAQQRFQALNARYQAGGHCTAPWHPLDPVLAPPPPAARGMFLDYPAARPY